MVLYVANGKARTPALDQLTSAITNPKMIDTEFIDSLRAFSVEHAPLRNMKLDWPEFIQLYDDCKVLCEAVHVKFEYDDSIGQSNQNQRRNKLRVIIE